MYVTVWAPTFVLSNEECFIDTYPSSILLSLNSSKSSVIFSFTPDKMSSSEPLGTVSGSRSSITGASFFTSSRPVFFILNLRSEIVAWGTPLA